MSVRVTMFLRYYQYRRPGGVGDTTLVRYKAVQGSIPLRSKYFYMVIHILFHLGIIFDLKINEIVRPFWNSTSILTICENKHLHYI